MTKIHNNHCENGLLYGRVQLRLIIRSFTIAILTELPHKPNKFTTGLHVCKAQ